MDLNRKDQLKKLMDKENQWDILVIGGGASGLGVALDGVSRGLSVLLVDKKDFGSGTSSRSTKLIHGGVRYLQQGNIRLVKEALRERAYFMSMAPHVTKIQSFIIPFYSVFMGIYYFIGLKLYDILAGSKNIGKTSWLRPSKVKKKLPNIRIRGLKGGIHYYDGQFDDSRFCIDLVRTIVKNGGTCLNYCSLSSFTKSDGKITGAVLVDELTNEEFIIKAKSVVNATGVFTNEILQLDNTKHKKMVVPSRGSHLVLDGAFLGGQTAMMIPKTTDGRILFLIPWKHKLLVGTTDIKTDIVEYDPMIDPDEIKFMLNNTLEYLESSPKSSDILSVFSGLRPLAAPKDEQSKTKEISRGHQIIWTESGICNIIGGKWTTFRKMGQDVISELATTCGWKIGPSTSSDIQIESIKNLHIYGGDIPDMAELRQIIRTEMVETLEDLVARRTRVLFLDLKLTLSLLDQWADELCMIKEKTQKWKLKEINHVTSLIKSLSLPFTQ